MDRILVRSSRRVERKGRDHVGGVLMTRVAALLAIQPVALGLALCAWSAPSMEAYHVVCARRELAAGEQVEVRLEPIPPPGTYIYWRTAQQIGMSPGSPEANRAVYTSPFVIPPGSPPADIRADLSGPETGRIELMGHVALKASALPASQECLAPGQTYSTRYGTIEPDGSTIIRVEGVVVHMGDPEYPKAAVSRQLTDVVPVMVLLCTSGRVLVAYPVTAYDDNRQPIEHDRILTEAAVTIAQSRTFAPLVKDGMPVAGWMHVHVAFRR